MKMKHILIYSISLFSLFVFGQEKRGGEPKAKEKIDSISKKPINKYSSIFIGVDLLSAGLSFIGERKGVKAFAHYQYSQKTALAIEGGYEQNKYNKINWQAEVSGPYLAVGLNYFFTIDKLENNFNGFYAGGRIANAFYNQEIKQFPIYGNNTSDLIRTGSLQSANINSTWVEMVFGGRVDFIKRKLYADISFRPRFHVFSTKQENIKPLVIPGFGNNINDLNFDLLFALAYQIDFKKNKTTETK